MVKERRLQIRESAAAAAAADEVKRGAWTAEEDRKLANYVAAHGHKHWRALPSKAGLKRCGKSCRLRWLNYLRPGIKRGNISQDEEDLIIRLHNLLGNRWSIIAGRIPGRTDNEIKNHWNTHLRKRSLSIEDLNNKLNHSTHSVTVLMSPPPPPSPPPAAAQSVLPKYSRNAEDVTPSTLKPADEKQGPAANSLWVDQAASEFGNEGLSEFSNELGLDGLGLLPGHHHDNNSNQDQFFEFEDLEQWFDYQQAYALHYPISG